MDPLALFHPVTAGWFGERHGQATPVQEEAWPVIARGEHVLAAAPTGSGKTLAAFLWALDRLLSGAWEGGTVRVLYVSPLRALANDIRRNLTGASTSALGGSNERPTHRIARNVGSSPTPP